MLAPTIYLLIEVFWSAEPFLQKRFCIVSSLRKISCTVAACKDERHFAILVLYDVVEDKGCKEAVACALEGLYVSLVSLSHKAALGTCVNASVLAESKKN